jgi:uncharacterized protein YndB with AHSA1/START domain
MATEKSKVSEAPAERSLVLTRVFDAPRRLVFEAWTKREHLDKWSAPRGFTMPSSEGDLRVGGAWRCLMIAPNGEKHPLWGVYREIVQDELLVFTHIWEADKPEHETVVTVRFADEGGKTKVTLEQSVFRSVESRNGHVGGWTECLDILGEHLAKLQGKEKP